MTQQEYIELIESWTNDKQEHSKETNREEFQHPTDIGIDLEGNLFIDMSLAGFSKENVKVYRENNDIVVEGTNDEEDVIERYYQQDIKCNTFKEVIGVSPEFIDGDIFASMYDGLLTIAIRPILEKESEREIVEIK